MNFFRFQRLPLYQAPDVQPGATPPVDPAVAAAAEQPAPVDPAIVSEIPVVAADDTIGDGQPPVEEQAEPRLNNRGKAPPPKWALDRISEQTERARRAEERALAAEELANRLQRQPASDGNPPAPAATDTDVETRAQAIANERISRDKISSVISAGLAKFPDWDERAATLGAAGAASPEFVLDVVTVDPANAHVLLHQLADDPQKAARLAKMDPRSRTIELVRMSMSTEKSPTPPPAPAAAPRTVSKAPAPPPPIQQGSSQAIDWRADKASDQDFSKGFDERMAKRTAKR